MRTTATASAGSSLLLRVSYLKLLNQYDGWYQGLKTVQSVINAGRWRPGAGSS